MMAFLFVGTHRVTSQQQQKQIELVALIQKMKSWGMSPISSHSLLLTNLVCCRVDFLITQNLIVTTPRNDEFLFDWPGTQMNGN